MNPKCTQSQPKWAPSGRFLVPEGTQRDPIDTPRVPKGFHRGPNRHPNVTKMLQREPLGNPRNSKSPIELSCESELDVLVKVSISLESEFDPGRLRGGAGLSFAMPAHRICVSGIQRRIPTIPRISMKWSLSRRSDPPFHTRRGLG